MLVEDHTKETKHAKLEGVHEDYIQIHIGPATWDGHNLKDATVISDHKFFVYGKKWKEICSDCKDVCRSSVSGRDIAYFEVKHS